MRYRPLFQTFSSEVRKSFFFLLFMFTCLEAHMLNWTDQRQVSKAAVCFIVRLFLEAFLKRCLEFLWNQWHGKPLCDCIDLSVQINLYKNNEKTQEIWCELVLLVDRHWYALRWVRNLGNTGGRGEEKKKKKAEAADHLLLYWGWHWACSKGRCPFNLWTKCIVPKPFLTVSEHILFSLRPPHLLSYMLANGTGRHMMRLIINATKQWLFCAT